MLGGFCLGCNQLYNCLVHVSFATKNEAGGRVEAKKVGFFLKIYMHTANWLPKKFCEIDALSTTNVSSK